MKGYRLCFRDWRVQLSCAERRTLGFLHLVKWKLKMSTIKPGDIVISKAGNTWISKTIAWLTESDVSHAAIVLKDGRIAEMGRRDWRTRSTASRLTSAEK